MEILKRWQDDDLKLNIVRSISLKLPLVRSEGRLVGHDGTLYAHALTTCLVFAVPPLK